MIRLTNRLFGSHPMVVHCPGALPDGWHLLAQAVLAQPPRRTACGELTILTWNSGDGGAKPKPPGTLEASLQRLGVAPVVLRGCGAAWTNLQKLALTAEALRHVTTPYVAGMDSSDVLVLDAPRLLVERFRAHFACPLVFNATGPPCWPLLPEYVAFESSRPQAARAAGRHWLNSGVWIGETAFCREFFARLADQPPVRGYEWSEQAVVKREWPRWYPRVQLDYASVLFQWFKEEPTAWRIERPPAPRQVELLKLLRPLGRRLCGAEVGVHEGDTADALLRELPELTLWLVDPWKPYRGDDSLAGRDAAFFARTRSRALWWTEHARDRRYVLEEPSPAAADRFADAGLDFAFLDANHRYESIRADLRAWWPKVRPGGLLCGHDYGVYGDATGAWGIRRAVDEWAAATDRPVRVGADGVWWITR